MVCLFLHAPTLTRAISKGIPLYVHLQMFFRPPRTNKEKMRRRKQGRKPVKITHAIVDGVRDSMHVPHNISHKTLTQLFISLV